MENSAFPHAKSNDNLLPVAPSEFQEHAMLRQKRFEKREQRAVNRDTFVQEEASLGLTVMDSPNDPQPSLRLEAGQVVEIDGRPEAEFDVIDRYIARYAINTETAVEAMAMDPLLLARMLVDISTPRKRLVQLLS